MNERIHQIAEQVYGSAATAQEIKFAEAIVRECATFVNNVMPVYSKDELDLCKRTAKQMKMYFGVKK
jgi:hypothetical protein